MFHMLPDKSYRDMRRLTGVTQTGTIIDAGTIIAHYKIIRALGKGGMDEVNLAEDSKLYRRHNSLFGIIGRFSLAH